MADFYATDFKYRRFNAVEAAPRNVATLTGAKRVTSPGSQYDWKKSKARACSATVCKPAPCGRTAPYPRAESPSADETFACTLPPSLSPRASQGGTSGDDSPAKAG